MILNYDDAYEAITRGETDWETLTCRVGRNDLPAILSEVAWSMTDDELASALRDSWVMAESPENCLDRETWIDLFEPIGYRHNTEPATPPSEVVLYRGGMHVGRMSWTADRELAEWFRDRYPGGQLWTATVGADALLAFYDGVRDGGGGAGETEYVIDPGLITPKVWSR